MRGALVGVEHLGVTVVIVKADTEDGRKERREARQGSSLRHFVVVLDVVEVLLPPKHSTCHRRSYVTSCLLRTFILAKHTVCCLMGECDSDRPQ